MAEASGAPLVGLRVLVVEDHDDSREMLEHFLRYAGALVMGATSARHALTMVSTVDVVVTDISMPGHSGVWLLQHLRERGTRIPVIAVTGIPNADLGSAAFGSVLRKPVDPWKLCGEIVRIVRPD